MKSKLLMLLFGVICSIGLVSCIKDDHIEVGDAGKTFLKFNDGPTKALFFSPFTDIKDITVFNIRRDPNSELTLNKPQSVTVKLVPQLVTDYNTEHNETFELLPASFYTYALETGMTVNGNDFVVNYAAGEFAKNLKIQLDGAQWVDLSKKYALAFVVSDAGGNTLSAAKDTMITFFSIKNKWDGVYEVSGTMVDVVNAALTHVNVGLASEGEDPLKIELRTISPTQCALFDATVVGNYAAPIWTGSAFSQYGSFSVIVEFDPATDKVVAVTNYSGQPAANTRYGQLDVSGVNEYDPATKTVTIKYNMCQPSVVLVDPYIRTTWDEVWKFIKDRE